MALTIPASLTPRTDQRPRGGSPRSRAAAPRLGWRNRQPQHSSQYIHQYDKLSLYKT